MRLPTLPTDYYLDHFTEMLGSVAETYAAILSDEHRRFIAQFFGLPKDARCLLIRMVNRRGSIFRRSALHYAEIGAIEEASQPSDRRRVALADQSAMHDSAAHHGVDRNHERHGA